MKYFLLLFCLLQIVCIKTFAQRPKPQDCLGALPICTDYYEEPDPFVVGRGNYKNEIRRTQMCYTIESDGAWYYFSPETSGVLRFNLIPNKINVDYDWIVFDLTNGDCADLAVEPEKYMISSNTYGPDGGYGSPYFYGVTGANSDSTLGFSGNCNGPGPYNGKHYNDDIMVVKDNFYVFYLARADTTVTHGYTLDFRPSTADIIDDKGPILKSITVSAPCGGNTITVRFNEKVRCRSVDVNTFELSRNGRIYPITSVTGNACLLETIYERDFVITTKDFLQPGEYTLRLKNTVYDACNNPSLGSSIVVKVNELKIINLTTRNIIGCKGKKNGYIRINASSSSEALYYSIDGGKTYSNLTGVFSGLAAGEYQVAVRNDNGCEVIGEKVIITEPDELLIDSVTVSDVATCYGASSGSIKIHISGGSGSYSYSINNGRNYYNNDGAFSGLWASDYTIKVTDSYGCLVSGDKVTIKQPQKVTQKVSHTDITTCYGDKSGEIKVEASGGTGDYSFSINYGRDYFDNNGVFSNLDAGTYNIRIRDSNRCGSSDTTIRILQPKEIQILSSAKTNVKACYGDSTGTVRITAIGGSGNLTFSIDDGKTFFANDGYFQNLKTGIYKVWVKDSNGCLKAGAEYVITQPSQLIISEISSKDVSTCYGDKTGEIVIKIKGGTPPYLYSSDGGKTFVNNGGSFNNMGAGQYEIVVKDAGGCSVVGDKVIIAQPIELVLNSVVFSDSLCYGDKSGYISILASGGTGSYSYSINNGIVYNPDKSYFENLSQGKYNVKVKDSGGCIVSKNNVQIVEKPEIKITSVDVKNINSCAGEKNGSINIKAITQNQILNYSIDGGKTFSNGALFENLPAGKYHVYVRSDLNCSVDVGEYTITEPSVLFIDSVAKSDVRTCYGKKEGQIRIYAHGGGGDLLYSIDAINFVSNNGFFDGLVAGIYTPVVKDANGCLKSYPAITITQPEPIVVSQIIQTDNMCYGQANGRIVVEANGGQGLLQFSIDGGSSFSGNNVFEKLVAATYPVFVKDSKGCLVSSERVVVGQPNKLTALIAEASDVSTCKGDATGAIKYTVIGGTGQLFYALNPNGKYETNDGYFTDLLAGDYKVFVKDENGCTLESNTMVVDEPSVVEITKVQTTDLFCHGDSSGTLTVAATGGTGQKQYSLDGGQTYIDVDVVTTKLSMGDYLVVVKDANGCLAEERTVKISQPEKLELIDLRKTDVLSCYGRNEGAIEIKAVGGTGDLIFAIDTIFATQNNNGVFSQLAAQIYFPVVRDRNNCMLRVDEIEILQPQSVKLSEVVGVDISCRDFDDGEIRFTVSGGQDAFMYSIDGGNKFSDSAVFTNLLGGEYVLIAKDANGCFSDMDTVVVRNPEMLKIDSVAIYDVEKCFGDITGQINIFASGGTGDFEYNLKQVGSLVLGELVSEKSSFMNLSQGNYIPTVSDVNGCVFVGDTVFIDQPPMLLVDSVSKTDITCNGLTNGEIVVFASGGTPAYKYSIDGGDIFVDNEGYFSNLADAWYPVYVKDDNECVAKGDSVHVIEPQEIKVVETANKSVSCFGGNDGALDISITGGNDSRLMFLWSNELRTEDISDLAADNYSVLVTDVMTNHCAAGFFVVEQPDSISVDYDITNARCEWIFNGQIDVSLSGGTSPYSSLWRDASGEEVFDLNALATGYYFLHVTDFNGCVLQDTVFMDFMDCELSFEIPNVFTPNGDGKNDWFYLQKGSKNVKHFEFSIFDRWGTPVFNYSERDIDTYLKTSSDEDAKGWDGDSKFGRVPPGVYFYVAKVTDMADKVIVREGIIHVFDR